MTAPDHRPVCLVTGATSGIGRATACRLAAFGRVVIVARDAQRGEAVLADIERRVGPGAGQMLVADLASGKQIHRLAVEACARLERLDVLVNNAGVFTRRRRTTEEGFELQFAVNYLAQFRLVLLLGPLLRASGAARVINVSSMEHYLGRIHFEDLQLEHGYTGSRAYRQSKLAVVMLSRELARRTAETRINVNAVHPGVVYTKLLRTINPLSRLVRLLLLSPDKAAGGLVELATAPRFAAVSGAYFHRTHRMPPSRRARDPEAVRRLWQATEHLTGLHWQD